MDRVPGDGINGAFSFGVSYVDTVAAIVIKGGSKVPTRSSMRGVGFTGSGRFVDQNFGTEGTKGSAIEIKSTVELCLGR